MYNNNTSPAQMDFKPSILNDTGKCVWGCYWIAVYNPITILPGGNYSWTWDQQGENGTVGPGIYNARLGGYYSNEFRITLADAILAYYRGLGQDPNMVETGDLLKAINDWRNGISPPGFSVPISTDQLLALANEWKAS
jgi:hypothetical protein